MVARKIADFDPCKNVNQCKIVPYADEWHPDTLIPPDNVKESGDRKYHLYEAQRVSGSVTYV